MKLGIVVPSKNPGDLIRPTLESIQAARRAASRNVEVRCVVVDSVSTDGTLQILEQAATSGICEFVHEPDRSMTEGLNKGIQLLKDCDILGTINAGDTYLPNAFVDVASSQETSRWDLGFFSSMVTKRGVKLVLTPKFVVSELGTAIFGWSVPECGVFFTRQVFDELGGFDEEFRYAYDIDFYTRSLFRHKKSVAVVSKIVSEFLEHNGLSLVHNDEVGKSIRPITRYWKIAEVSYRTKLYVFLQYLFGVRAFQSIGDAAMLMWRYIRLPTP